MSGPTTGTSAADFIDLSICDVCSLPPLPPCVYISAHYNIFCVSFSYRLAVGPFLLFLFRNESGGIEKRKKSIDSLSIHFCSAAADRRDAFERSATCDCNGSEPNYPDGGATGIELTRLVAGWLRRQSKRVPILTHPAVCGLLVEAQRSDRLISGPSWHSTKQETTTWSNSEEDVKS